MTYSNLQTKDINQVNAQLFCERIAQTLDAGAISVMLSIGHRTGLFDTMATMPPSTSRQIADEAALSERYVREWLAVMVVARIVDYDSQSRTYVLPEDNAACLTRDGLLGNLAVYAQSIALAGAVQESVLECFETGCGIDYADYPCFHQIMAEDSGQTVVAVLHELLRELVPDLIEKLEKGIHVLDAGCGAGSALIDLATTYPNSRFTGYDLCPDAIAMATRDTAAQGLENIVFRQNDLTQLDVVEEYDFIASFDAVHDTKEPQRLLKALYSALKPGGTYLMQDIGGSAYLENNLDFPFAAFLYTLSTVHCTPVSLAQGGQGLGTMWGWETAEQMLREAGYKKSNRHVLAHDPMNVWFVCRK